MIKTLLKLQLEGLCAKFRGRFGKRGRRGAVGALVLIVVLIILIESSLYSLFSGICGLFVELGIEWLYFALYLALATFLIFFASVFMTKNVLYDAKDNELLLSMPIPPSAILFSRTATLIIFDYVFALIAALPTAAAWIICGAPTLTGAFCFIILTLTLPLFVFAITAVFAKILAFITSLVRRKSLVTTVLSLIFFALYFAFCYSLGSATTVLTQNGGTIAEVIARFKPSLWFGEAISKPNLYYALAFAGVFVSVFAAATFVLAKTFIRTITVVRGSKKIVYKERAARVSSQTSALLRREFTRLFASPAYLLNAGMGVLFELIFAGYLTYSAISGNFIADRLIKYAETTGGPAAVMQIKNLITATFLTACCAFSAVILITASSISTEGRCVWILKSLPVGAEKILISKLLVQLILTLPATVISEIALIILLRPNALTAISIAVIPLAFATFSALLGLNLNLDFPRLDWTTESQAVKQGASVSLTMLLSVFAAAAIMLSQIKTDVVKPEYVLIAYAAIIVAATALLAHRLLTKGVKKFKKL